MNLKTRIFHLLTQHPALPHILFWLYALLAAPLFAEVYDQTVLDSLIYRAIGLPIKMMAAYLLAYYQIPRLLQQKRYWQFVLSLVGSVIVFTVIYRFNNVQFAEPLAGDASNYESISQILAELRLTILSYFFRVYSYPILFVILKILLDQANERQTIERLEKEKTTAELNFLKAQIHPHFLFNTLNNLYALCLEKSDQAPAVVAKLAEILDYILYQCNEPRVSVQKEIQLLENYIDLEKLRYGDRLTVDFSHKLTDPQARIAPLILLSLVENAFKHGASGAIAQPEIRIRLGVKAGRLSFHIFNTRSSLIQADPQGIRKGIGSSNVHRQLDLIYPDQYLWEIQETEQTYTVELSISL